MSKFTKLINNPIKFFRDSKITNIFSNFNYKENFALDEESWDDSKPLAVCIGFNPWKRDYFREYLPSFNVIFVKGKTPAPRVLGSLKTIKEDYTVFIWSYKEPKSIYKYLKKNNITIRRVEDGFIRSIGLGSNKTKPLSLVIDDDSLYFNSRTESKLEKLIIDNHDYTEKKLQRSKELIASIIQHKISKYNFIHQNNIDLDSLVKEDKKTILVIGQVEDDMSIKMGYNGKITNLELLILAKEENKHATILFKPHPDVLTGNRKNSATIDDYEQLCTIVPQEANLHNLIEISNHIYTITSLSGFEALLYRKKVTCLGSPFYAHWGLTDDRQTTPSSRNNINLTLEELVYSALIEYPKYLYDGPEKTIEAILNRTNMRPYDFSNIFSFCTIDGNKNNTLDLLNDFKDKKVALITCNSDINQLYLGLNDDVSSLDVFATTLNVENIIREKGIVNPEKCKFIVKAFMAPLSDIEANAIKLTQKISNNYTNIIQDIVSTTFDNDEAAIFTKIVSDDLEDKIFNDCVLYLTLNTIATQYDYVIYNYKHDTSDAVLELFKAPIFQDKIYISTTNIISLQKKLSKNVSPEILYNTNTQIKNVTLSLNKIWNTARYNYSLGEKERDSSLTLCANITDRNYAYYPSAQEVLNVSKQYNLDIHLLPAIYVNDDRYNHYKQIMLEDTGVSLPTEVFSSFIKNILKANKNLGYKVKNSICPKITSLTQNLLFQELPNELYLFLLPRINKNIDEFGLHCAMYYKMIQYMSKTNMFVTTMERSVISRLATLAARKHNIPTIGIQPQVISTSKRYRLPLVDKMLIIDSLQEENFISLGYPENKMEKIGSANLRKHLNLINTAENIQDETSLSILFIMQHSMPDIMYKSIEALKEIDSTFHIYIKPHPFQEKIVLNTIASTTINHTNITLLDKDAETYQYIKHVNIVTGLFSSAIYEAILANKDVVVLKLEELDPSIDFAKFGTCMQISNTAELKLAITSFIKNDQRAKQIRETQRKYISDNNYIYSTDKLIEQIIPKDK